MCNNSDEIERIEYLFSKDVFDVDKRYEDCQKWYSEKAEENKRLSYIFTALSGVCPIVSSILYAQFLETSIGSATCPFLTFIIPFISCVASVSVVLGSMTKAHEKWISYRSSAEVLKRMRCEYLMERKIMNNNGSSDDDLLKLEQKFLSEMEEYMSNENQQWHEMRSKKPQLQTLTGTNASNG